VFISARIKFFNSSAVGLEYYPANKYFPDPLQTLIIYTLFNTNESIKGLLLNEIQLLIYRESRDITFLSKIG